MHKHTSALGAKAVGAQAAAPPVCVSAVLLRPPQSEHSGDLSGSSCSVPTDGQRFPSAAGQGKASQPSLQTGGGRE